MMPKMLKMLKMPQMPEMSQMPGARIRDDGSPSRIEANNVKYQT